MNEERKITRYLMPDREAMKAENIIKLFEALKGRPAAPDEIANVERKLKELYRCAINSSLA